MKTKLILLLVSVFHIALTKAQETAMSSAEITSFKQTVVAEAQKIKTSGLRNYRPKPKNCPLIYRQLFFILIISSSRYLKYN